MRVIGGQFRGRILKSPKGIRPTSQRVKEALFDILADRVVEAEVLELFAGGGGLGIEALSRGARSVIFVDSSQSCARAIRENLNRLKLLEQKADILELDALRAIRLLAKRKSQFDLIFLDPPYYKGLAEKSLQCLYGYDILKPHSLIMVEQFKKDAILKKVGNLHLLRKKVYGDTLLLFYRRKLQ